MMFTTKHIQIKYEQHARVLSMQFLSFPIK